MTKLQESFAQQKPKPLPEGVLQPYIDHPGYSGSGTIGKDVYRLSSGTEILFEDKIAYVRDKKSDNPKVDNALDDISMSGTTGRHQYSIGYNLYMGEVQQSFNKGIHPPRVISTPFTKLDPSFGVGADLKEVIEIAGHRGLVNLPPIPTANSAPVQAPENSFDR